MTHLPDWTSRDVAEGSMEFGEGMAVLELTLEGLESL